MLTLILDPTNPLTVPPGEQNGAGPAIPERPDYQEEFNFLGGRPGGVGLEEAQEQNAIVNAINLVVRLSLLIYITYQFAPQYKFYLVIAFSGLWFLYQVGVFRVNRVNVPRFQQVEEGLRQRENNNNDEVRENVQEETARKETTHNSRDVKSQISEETEEIGVATEEEEVTRQRVTEQVTREVPGLISSLSLLLYNLVLSFHPEHNVQV